MKEDPAKKINIKIVSGEPKGEKEEIKPEKTEPVLKSKKPVKVKKEQIKEKNVKKEAPKIPPDLAMPKAKPFSFKDAYAWTSILVSLVLFVFSFFAVSFLYRVSSKAFQIREDVINSQVVEYDWAGYQKVADKLGIQ